MGSRRTTLATVNRYGINTDGSGLIGATLKPNMVNFALSSNSMAFVGAQVSAPVDLTLEHGIFVGIRMPEASPVVASTVAQGFADVPVAPGGLFSVPAGGLASDPAGVLVKINGTPAAVVAVTPEKVDIIAPSTLPPGAASIQMESKGKALPPIPAEVVPAAPIILTTNPMGIGTAAASRPDASPIAPEQPATPGESIVLSVTGLGAKTDGLRVFFAGKPGQVESVTKAPKSEGVHLVKVKLPEDLVSLAPVPIAIRMGDSLSDLAELPVGPKP